MHGVQPMAKIAPSANDVPRPALPPTSRLPIRPPTPASAGASDIPPVIVVTLAEAPASSGRQVRSRNGIGSRPARLRPMTTSRTPPTIRSVGM